MNARTCRSERMHNVHITHTLTQCEGRCVQINRSKERGYAIAENNRQLEKWILRNEHHSPIAFHIRFPDVFVSPYDCIMAKRAMPSIVPLTEYHTMRNRRRYQYWRNRMTTFHIEINHRPVYNLHLCYALTFGRRRWTMPVEEYIWFICYTASTVNIEPFICSFIAKTTPRTLWSGNYSNMTNT